MHLQIFTFIHFYSTHELNIIRVSEMHVNFENPYYNKKTREDNLSNKNRGGVCIRLVTF